MIGSVHARAVHWAGGELTAVAVSNPESSRTARERLNAKRAATAEEIAHADDVDVDVVHVCTPNHLHHDVVLAALTAGKGVVCES
jgi:predicted dehydrogenase